VSRRALLLLPLLAGCAGAVMPDPVRLPRDSVEGAGDPTRAAVSRAAFAFNQPGQLAGRPAEAARAIADMEFLAAALPFDPRFQQRDPLLPFQLAQARAEWRTALGIPDAQPAQPVIDSLYAMARTGNALLPLGIFGLNAGATLAALPPLPQTGRAAAGAARALFDNNIPTGRRRF